MTGQISLRADNWQTTTTDGVVQHGEYVSLGHGERLAYKNLIKRNITEIISCIQGKNDLFPQQGNA